MWYKWVKGGWLLTLSGPISNAFTLYTYISKNKKIITKYIYFIFMPFSRFEFHVYLYLSTMELKLYCQKSGDWFKN